jgi:cytochrome c oxidase cbb3-type subunit 3
MADHKHVDEVTGVSTTGHVWDGDIRELDKPLPKWWLQVFYVCIVWSFIYWVFYPAWPLVDSYTTGWLGYTERAAVTKEVAAARAAQSGMVSKIAAAKLEDIPKNKELLQFAVAGGGALFGDNCSGCHGRGAQGHKGYPNLNDDDWLWGGKIADIHQTIRYGIRNEHAESRQSAMPRYGIEGLLKPAEITDSAHHVLSLSGAPHDAAAAKRGSEIYANNCAACHGEAGKGNVELGAPNLADRIWLYGGTLADVTESISTGRGGAMPQWTGRLKDEEVKMLAVYVHALGGGIK